MTRREPMSDVWSRDEIESPCVNVCLIHPEARICVGCYRTGDEIARWSRMAPEARRALMEALPSRASALPARRGGAGRTPRPHAGWRGLISRAGPIPFSKTSWYTRLWVERSLMFGKRGELPVVSLHDQATRVSPHAVLASHALKHGDFRCRLLRGGPDHRFGGVRAAHVEVGLSPFACGCAFVPDGGGHDNGSCAALLHCRSLSADRGCERCRGLCVPLGGRVRCGAGPRRADAERGPQPHARSGRAAETLGWALSRRNSDQRRAHRDDDRYRRLHGPPPLRAGGGSGD